MARYIDVNEALRMMRNSKQDNPYDSPKKAIWEIAHDCCISCVDAVSTADVVEVVRCKHCSYRKTHICAITGAKTLFCDYWDKPYPIEEEHYCGYGTRTPKERE